MQRRLVSSFSFCALAFHRGVCRSRSRSARARCRWTTPWCFRRGVFRLRTLGQWTVIQRALRDGHAGSSQRRARAARRRLLARHHRSEAVSSFAALQDGVQQLTGNPELVATLGNTQVNLRDRIAAYPIVFDMGLSNRCRSASGSLRQTHSVGLLQRQHELNAGKSRFNPGLGRSAAAVTT